MPKTINIDAKFTCYSTVSIELPEGYSEDDIKDITLKWNRVEFIFFKDGVVAHSNGINPKQYHWGDKLPTFIELQYDNVMDERDGNYKWADAISVWDEDYTNITFEMTDE